MSDVTFTVSREDAWRIYDLVTGRSELIAAQEYQAMQSLGGSPWYALAKTIREALETTPTTGERWESVYGDVSKGRVVGPKTDASTPAKRPE